MKKSKFAMMVICVIALVSCSIEDNIELESQNNLKALQNDQKFISSVESTLDLVDMVVDVEKIKSLQDNPNLGIIEINELSSAMGFQSFDEFEAYMVRQKENYDLLEKQYELSSYSYEDLTNLIESYLNTTIDNTKPISDDCNCERIRINCNTEVMAAALVATWGCAAVDWTGIGAIVCHSAVIIAQIVASDNCNANAENCRRDCEKNSK